MMPRGDLRVKFASFGKLPRMKKPIGRIISDWLGSGAACPKPANSLLAVASENFRSSEFRRDRFSSFDKSDIEHLTSDFSNVIEVS